MRRSRIACVAVVALAALLGAEVEAGKPRGKRGALREAAGRELSLTQTANEIERGKVALERERESLAWASNLLERRGAESLRKLDAYRVQRVEREQLGAARARKLYKLARGGGMLEMMFADGGDGRLTATERIARGRTLRRLIDHDLVQLQIHAGAERDARAELLTATRESAVLRALDSLGRLQQISVEDGGDQLHPSLASAHRQRRALQERVTGKSRPGERALLAQVHRERKTLRGHRGLDLLEEDALVRPAAGRIVGGFGDYEDKLLKVPMHRNGVELAAKPNDAIKALAPGEVVFVGALPGFERVVVVDHGGGYLSLTARLLTVHVEEGETLEAGAVLGRVGPKAVDDGLGTTVYVELRHGQRPIDPEPYLRPRKRHGR